MCGRICQYARMSGITREYEGSISNLFNGRENGVVTAGFVHHLVVTETHVGRHNNVCGTGATRRGGYHRIQYYYWSVHFFIYIKTANSTPTDLDHFNHAPSTLWGRVQTAVAGIRGAGVRGCVVRGMVLG